MGESNGLYEMVSDEALKKQKGISNLWRREFIIVHDIRYTWDLDYLNLLYA